MAPAKFLLIRPDRIGDVVLSTAIPRELKKNIPDSFVAVLVRNYTKDIYQNNPNVDEIIIYDENSSLLNLTKQLKKYNFDFAFMLLPNEKINWAMFLSGIKYRIGVGHKFYQFITNTKSIYRHKYIPLRHEADYCMDAVRKININPADFLPEIYLTDEEKESAKKIKKSIAPGDEFIIGINSTSGNSAPNMKAGEYKKLLEKLVNLKNVKAVVTDYDPPTEIKDIENVFYPNEGKKLRESIINFSSLDLLISASTGPMHIAAALKVKTVSLFCPYPASSPKLWGPLGNESSIIFPEENYHGIVCSGNPKTCCFEGDSGINAEKVYKFLLKNFKLN